MSQYLNSFLIEPVVRQARRFSRQSNDDRPFRPLDVHPPSEEGAEIRQSTPWVHPEAVAPETNWQRTPQVTERATAAPDVGLRYSEDPSDAEVRAWRDVHQPLGTSHEASLAAVISPDSTLPNDQFSSNPVYSAAESLRSTTSSLAMDSDAMEVQGSAQSSIQHPTDAINPSVQTGDGALPEDDGMTAKRRQIVAIHNTHSSNTEKARLVHRLMNERYSSLQPNLQTPYSPSTRSLASHANPNPSTSGHTGSTVAPSTFPPVSLSVSSETNDLFNLSLEDLKPTYHQKPEVHQTSSGPGNRSSHRLSQESLPEYKVLGCPHYKRNIKLQCSECHRWYTCRFCHDEVENHCLNRPETKNMLCMFCGCAQPASGECTRCGEQSARYYCGVCKFWDNSPGKSIYHCNDCGICRIGEGLGKDFFHCKTCNACLSIRTMENHRCIERSTDCDCPICGEYMFTSPQTVVFMRCGHAIHHLCYYEHAKRSYRCPICSKSMANMEAQFRQIERSIESQPMPPEYQDAKAWVYCNDCNAKSSVKYHWLGLKCGVCDSYNTATIQIIRGTDQRSVLDRPGVTSTAFHSRGGAVDIATQAQRGTNSAPPSAVISPTQLTRPVESQNLEEFAREVVAMDEHGDSIEAISDGDYSDVDFWGLESPSARGTRGSPDGPAEDDSSDENSSQGVANDNDCTAPGDDGDDDEEDDAMEIFGHR